MYIPIQYDIIRDYVTFTPTPLINKVFYIVTSNIFVILLPSLLFFMACRIDRSCHRYPCF